MPNPIEAMLRQKQAMTPKSGFNLVGLDDYEKPGEQLFLISSHKTERDAVKAQKEYMKKNRDSQTFIYGKEGQRESVADEMNALLSDLAGDE